MDFVTREKAYLQCISTLGGTGEVIERNHVSDGISYVSILLHEYSPHFGYFVGLYSDGDVEIFAKINSDEKLVFWHVAYELEDYNSISDMDDQVFEIIKNILSYKTKITRHNGLLSFRFDCHFLKDDQWHTIHGDSYMRFSNFNLPKGTVWESN